LKETFGAAGARRGAINRRIQGLLVVKDPRCAWLARTFGHGRRLRSTALSGPCCTMSDRWLRPRPARTLLTAPGKPR